MVADEHAPAAPLPAGAAGRGLSPARGGAAVLQPGSAEPDAPLLGGFGAAALPAGGAEPDAPRLGGAGDAADLDAALLAVASPLAAMPAGVHVGTFVHRAAAGRRLRRARPRRRAARGTSPPTRRARRTSATRRSSSAGLRRRAAHAARAAARRPAAVRRHARRPPRRAGLRAAARRRRRAGRRRASTSPRSARCCASTSRPATRSPATRARLSDPALRQGARGYLTGSIDLVLRDGERFAVVDYKTNLLAGPGEELTRVASPPGRARRRDGALSLRLAGAAVHRGASPLLALAAARL